MARKLKDIEVDEISLVDAAATRKTFFIKKQKERKSMEKLIELLKSFFGDEFTDEDIAKAKEIPEDTQKGFHDALNILNEYKPDFPQDILGAITVVAKQAATGQVEKEVEKEVDILAEMIDAEKAGAKLSKATLEQLKKIHAIIEGMIGVKEKGLKKSGDEKLSPETIARLEKLDAMEKDEAEREKKEKSDKEKKLQDEIDNLKKEVEKLGKTKGIKKSLTDEPEEDEKTKKKKTDKEDEIPEWPSFTKQAEVDED